MLAQAFCRIVWGHYVMYKRSFYLSARVSGNACRARANVSTSEAYQVSCPPLLIDYFQPLIGAVISLVSIS